MSRNAGKPAPATIMTIGADYLETLRIPVFEGRDFNVSDRADGLPVAIVNQTLARRFWPNESPVGSSFFSAATIRGS